MQGVVLDWTCGPSERIGLMDRPALTVPCESSMHGALKTSFFSLQFALVDRKPRIGGDIYTPRINGDAKGVFNWYLCFYPHWSRELVSPVCGIFVYLKRN